MAFYPSRLKISNVITKKQFDRHVSPHDKTIMQCEKENIKILASIVPEKYVHKILSLIQDHITEIDKETVFGGLKIEL